MRCLVGSATAVRSIVTTQYCSRNLIKSMLIL
jgi:hypothetical protein